MSARIVAVADFYDTATHPRPYRASVFSHEDVCKAIRGERERAFDPFVVDAFLRADAAIADVSRALTDRPEPINGRAANSRCRTAGTWQRAQVPPE